MSPRRRAPKRPTIARCLLLTCSMRPTRATCRAASPTRPPRRMRRCPRRTRRTTRRMPRRSTTPRTTPRTKMKDATDGGPVRRSRRLARRRRRGRNGRCGRRRRLGCAGRGCRRMPAGLEAMRIGVRPPGRSSDRLRLRLLCAVRPFARHAHVRERRGVRHRLLRCGFDDCDLKPETGCETRLADDASNCGGVRPSVLGRVASSPSSARGGSARRPALSVPPNCSGLFRGTTTAASSLPAR